MCCFDGGSRVDFKFYRQCDAATWREVTEPSQALRDCERASALCSDHVARRLWLSWRAYSSPEIVSSKIQLCLFLILTVGQLLLLPWLQLGMQ